VNSSEEQSVRFEQFFAAPRERVFAWFSIPENVGRLFPGRTRRLRPADDPAHPDGVGAVREVRVGLVRLEETITRYERPTLIEYKVTHGWAIREHVGCLRFEAVPGGTQLEYVIRFRSRLPFAGGLVAGSLCSSWRRRVPRAIEGITTAAA
jgi:uncharacterized protein YndB with AHSA1/START domain